MEAKSNHKTVVISILNNSRKEDLSNSIPKTKVSKFNIKKVHIAMIGRWLLDSLQTKKSSSFYCIHEKPGISSKKKA